MTMRSWMAAAVVLVLLPACANGQDADGAASAQATEERPADASAAAGALDDAAIAHIAVTANAIDADMGELALSRSSDARVREFASTMVRDHRGVNEQAVALATRLGVTPSDNDVSRGLAADGESAAARLRGLSGAGFDAAYMEREVTYHAAVLDALDRTLIPNATNAELRSLLETARGAVAAHLEHARALRSELQQAGAR